MKFLALFEKKMTKIKNGRNGNFRNVRQKENHLEYLFSE